MSIDPLRPVDVPAGDFYEILRRSTEKHVIVSLMGPPLLTDEQLDKLGAIKPKVVAFCSGSIGGKVDLSLLFKAKLVHAAVTCNANPQPLADKKSTGEIAFNQFYQVIRATETAPAKTSAKPK
jgi:hypothetical protein